MAWLSGPAVREGPTWWVCCCFETGALGFIFTLKQFVEHVSQIVHIEANTTRPEPLALRRGDLPSREERARPEPSAPKATQAGPI